MTKHSSLKASGKIQSKRNVLKRFERINQLKTDGRWAEGKSAFGLPKTKPLA